MYKKGKKKNYRERKKKVSTVATVLPDTVATVLWKVLYEHCKKYCRKKKVQRSWLGKNKKSDEQYVLNKPKVLYKLTKSAVVFTYLPNKC